MIKPAERRVFEELESLGVLPVGGRCSDGNDPPDFLCTDSRGRRVGIELAEWVHERQIAASKPRHRIGASLSAATSSLDVPSQNVGRIQLFPTQELQASDIEQFRRELADWIASVEAVWSQFAERDTLTQGVPVRDFQQYPLVRAHLSQIDVFPRTEGRSVGIGIFAGGGPYSTNSAFEALLTVLGKKVKKYSELHATESLNELWLVIYYWQGYLHNTPYDSPGYGLPQIGAELAPLVQTDHGLFDRIYLFDVPKRELVSVWL